MIVQTLISVKRLRGELPCCCDSKDILTPTLGAAIKAREKSKSKTTFPVNNQTTQSRVHVYEISLPFTLR